MMSAYLSILDQEIERKNDTFKTKKTVFGDAMKPQTDHTAKKPKSKSDLHLRQNKKRKKRAYVLSNTKKETTCLCMNVCEQTRGLAVDGPPLPREAARYMLALDERLACSGSIDFQASSNGDTRPALPLCVLNL